MTTPKQFRSLTGLRGIAAWWVVLFHIREVAGWDTAFLAQGYLAVDLFFILSGFIIGLNCVDRFTSLKLTDYCRFLGVRLARIYPLHLFMLVVFLLNPLAIFLFSQRPVGQDYEFSY